MKIYRIARREGSQDNRKLGKNLFEQGYKTSVPIYRAQPAISTNIVDKDYVTLSYQFAIDHAKHMAACTNEDYIVVRARVPPQNVYNAYNPGEYFYSGPVVPAQEMKRFTAEEFGLD